MLPQKGAFHEPSQWCDRRPAATQLLLAENVAFRPVVEGQNSPPPVSVLSASHGKEPAIPWHKIYITRATARVYLRPPPLFNFFIWLKVSLPGLLLFCSLTHTPCLSMIHRGEGKLKNIGELCALCGM